jgi:uncharacterized protein YecT (DUF1311 family)
MLTLQMMHRVTFTTESSIHCHTISIQALDDLMNEIWSSLKKKIKENPDMFISSTKPFETILNAQRKWLDYRKVKCEFLYTLDGTIHTQLASSCYYNETKEKVKEINYFLSLLNDY